MNTFYVIRYFIYSYFGLYSQKRRERIEKDFLARKGVTQQTGDKHAVVTANGNSTSKDDNVVWVEKAVVESSTSEAIILRMHKEKTTGKYLDPDNNWEYTYKLRPYIAGQIIYEKEQLYGEFAARVVCPTFLGCWWAFWACSQKVWPPEIDHEFFWYTKVNSLSPGHYWRDGEKIMSKSRRLIGKAISKLDGMPKGGDLILSYEWREGFIKWKINGVTIRKVTNDIPNVGMNQIFRLSCHVDRPLPVMYTENQYIGSLKVLWFRGYE